MDDVFSSGETTKIAAVIAAFEAAGLSDSREVSFLRSCDQMLAKRGHVTPQMHGWLDQLLKSGGPRLPSAEDAELADLLASSVEEAGTQSKFMSNVIARLRAGQPIGDRQRKAVLDLHERVQRTRGMGDLTQSELRAMSLAHLVRLGYSHGYISARPGSFIRADEIWVRFRDTGFINRVDWETISTIMARLRDVAYPKHSPGDLLYLKPHHVPVVVIDPVSVNEWGTVGHNVLIEGRQLFVSLDLLRTRAPRGT